MYLTFSALYLRKCEVWAFNNEKWDTFYRLIGFKGLWGFNIVKGINSDIPPPPGLSVPLLPTWGQSTASLPD